MRSLRHGRGGEQGNWRWGMSEVVPDNGQGCLDTCEHPPGWAKLKHASISKFDGSREQAACAMSCIGSTWAARHDPFFPLGIYKEILQSFRHRRIVERCRKVPRSIPPSVSSPVTATNPLEGDPAPEGAGWTSNLSIY